MPASWLVCQASVTGFPDFAFTCCSLLKLWPILGPDSHQIWRRAVNVKFPHFGALAVVTTNNFPFIMLLFPLNNLDSYWVSSSILMFSARGFWAWFSHKYKQGVIQLNSVTFSEHNTSMREMGFRRYEPFSLASDRCQNCIAIELNTLLFRPLPVNQRKSNQAFSFKGI